MMLANVAHLPFQLVGQAPFEMIRLMFSAKRQTADLVISEAQPPDRSTEFLLQVHPLPVGIARQFERRLHRPVLPFHAAAASSVNRIPRTAAQAFP